MAQKHVCFYVKAHSEINSTAVMLVVSRKHPQALTLFMPLVSTEYFGTKNVLHHNLTNKSFPIGTNYYPKKWTSMKIEGNDVNVPNRN